MKKYAGFNDIPKDEREAFILAAEAAQSEAELAALERIIKARCRKASKAASDKRQRTLIGVRVPKKQAEHIKLAAIREGKSVYKFVQEAIYRAAKIPMVQKNDVRTKKEDGEQAY